MSLKVTIATTDNLAAAVNTVIADYVIEHSGNRGLTRAQIVEIQLTNVDHEEVNYWAGDVSMELMAAYHQVLNAIDDDPAALDRAVFGQPVIATGQPVMFRAHCTAAAKKWWAGGNFIGWILDATPDADGDVLVGWGGIYRDFLTGTRRYRRETRMNPADLLNP